MLDFVVRFFEIHLPSKIIKNDALVLNGCNAYFKENRDIKSTIYSELEELSYAYLNNNDYNSNSLEVEFCFENNQGKPYHWFYANCFSIRTDNGLTIKLDSNRVEKYLTKISMRNQMVLGIGIFFRNIKEYELIKESKFILMEGFVALDKVNNTYEIACKLEKINGAWKINFANTFQMSKRDNIRSKSH